MRGEQFAHALQARLEEPEVVPERVVVAERPQQLRAITAAAEPAPAGAGVLGHGERPASLRPAGVERRIDVGEVEDARRQRLQRGQIVAHEDEVVVQRGDLRDG